MSSCSARCSTRAEPHGDPEGPRGPMEPTGTPCTPQMGSGLGTPCQTPQSGTGKDPNPLSVEPTPLPCPHTALGSCTPQWPRVPPVGAQGHPTPCRAGNGVPAPTLGHPRAPPGAGGMAQGPAVVSILLPSLLPGSPGGRGVLGGARPSSSDTCATAAPSPLWGSPTARPPGHGSRAGGVWPPPTTGSGDLRVSALTPGRRGWDFSSFAPFNGHPGLHYALRLPSITVKLIPLPLTAHRDKLLM